MRKSSGQFVTKEHFDLTMNHFNLTMKDFDARVGTLEERMDKLDERMDDKLGNHEKRICILEQRSVKR